MKHYDAYLFDLYGTLVDIHTDERKPGFWKMVAEYYSAHGAEYGAQALREAYLQQCDLETKHLTAAQGCTEREAEIDLYPVFAALYRRQGVEASAELVAETAWFFRQSSTMHLRLYAGAKELLQSLRQQGKHVFLLSKAQALFTRPELELLGIADSFDAVYISSDCGYRKPAAQFLNRLLEEQHLDPRTCIMIGNDPNADVAVANACSVDSFYLRSASSPRIAPENVPATYFQQRINLRALRKRILDL